MKRVALELGGKSAQIYLPDAVRPGRGRRGGRGRDDLRARPASPRPGCSCPRRARTRCSRRSAAAYGTLEVGPPTRSGRDAWARSSAPPSASAASASSRSPRSTAARSSSAAAGRPGSTGATTSSRPCSTCPTTPTRRRRRRSSARCSRVIGYRDVDDAVRIANDSVYGLSAQVYGADVAAATAVARRLRTGAVNVNTGDVQRLRPERRLQAERPRPRARRRTASARSRRSSTSRSANCLADTANGRSDDGN